VPEASTVLQQAVERAAVTRAVIVDPDAIARLPGLLADLGLQRRRCQLIADPHTLDAAGARTQAVLHAAGIAVNAPIVLDESPRLKPRVETARTVAQQLGDANALPVAVGAGVIGDLTKYAAAVAGRPYVCVATAASMDGYAASGAALLDGGFKRTFPCAPPLAVVADLDVIAAAPPRMAAWGYGDLSGKLVAGADWVLADALGEDAIDAAPFALVQDHVKGWLADSARIATRDVDALRGLTNGLLISGFAMQAHGTSRPASGSEHQMAHVWEMERLTVDGEPAAHGACVGVATVAMLALYEWLLAQDIGSAVRASPHDPQRIDDELRASFAEPSLVDNARAEMSIKLAQIDRRPARVLALRTAWPALRERLRTTLVPAATLARWLTACGAASHPSDIGVTLAKLAVDYRRARLIRRRYTILDCLDDLGWLDVAFDALCGETGYWGRPPAASPDRR
jgi:glycerol-1-phosphate dehydrogenase [NAD(P)+]